MKTIYLVVAREDDWETSLKVIGMYKSVEVAKADLNKRFEDLRDKPENEYLWKDRECTNEDVKSVLYFYGNLRHSGYRTKRQEIAILEQQVDV